MSACARLSAPSAIARATTSETASLCLRSSVRSREFGLGLLAVGDEAALEAVARTLDVGEQRGEHAAGAAFGGRDASVPGRTSRASAARPARRDDPEEQARAFRSTALSLLAAEWRPEQAPDVAAALRRRSVADGAELAVGGQSGQSRELARSRPTCAAGWRPRPCRVSPSSATIRRSAGGNAW